MQTDNLIHHRKSGKLSHKQGAFSSMAGSEPGGSAFPEHDGSKMGAIMFDINFCRQQPISRWFQMLVRRDPSVAEHTLRVTGLSFLMAQKTGFTEQQLFDLQIGTLLHDIGKLAIPSAIMAKPGKLTLSERQIVRQHPVFGHEWLLTLKDSESFRTIPLFHHERWDGTGYPYGLSRVQIPLTARIVSLADVWDAITSDRPYRGAMSLDQAIALIEAESGRSFEPDLVRLFIDSEMFAQLDIPVTLPPAFREIVSAVATG